MNPVQLPPKHLKKGIKVLQNLRGIQADKSRERQQFDSNFPSVRSSRSRGISMSRQTGITFDRIYQGKHFLPPKPSQKKEGDKDINGESHTLISYKSLNHINLKEQNTERKQQNIQQAEIGQKRQYFGSSSLKYKNAAQSNFQANIGEKQEKKFPLHPNIISF